MIKDLTEDSIDDLVEQWNTTDTDKQLHEFLGMTWEDYCLWVNNKEFTK
jgi:DNA-directed RNA polymerase specialized sigma subunit